MTAPRQRTFARRRILELTADTYATATALLAETARQRFGPVAGVIGIGNGGLPPAAALAERLGTPMHAVAARHNRTGAVYTEATGEVQVDVSQLRSRLAGRQLSGRLLLVDDICGTGATFDVVLPALTAYLTVDALVRTVALCRNTAATTTPDLWLWTVDDWVHFPWEPAPPAGLTRENLVTPSATQPR